jgi:hypothetical protein
MMMAGVKTNSLKRRVLDKQHVAYTRDRKKDVKMKVYP